MSDISIARSRSDSASTSLQVTVPSDRVKAAEKRAVRFYSSRARLPGFRQGKAPEAVIRRRYGDAIRQSVLEEVIRESCESARADEALKPIAEPHVHNVKFTEEGGPIEFEFVVEVRPEIVLKRLGGFSLTREVPAVDDEQVAQQLQELQERKGRWLPVDGARPEPGNMVRVEVAAWDGDEKGEVRPYNLVIGEGQTLPELEEHIMSLQPGEAGEATIRFPEDHPDESRRGQSRRVSVALHEVKRQELPELDDDFAREVGDFESLDALRTTVRGDLERGAAREADSRVRDQLIHEVAEANDVPAPPSLVERVIRGYAQAYEVPQEQLERFAGEFRPIAEAQVRREIIIENVAELNSLRATEEELDARIAQMADARGLPVNDIYASLQKSNRLTELERALTEEKVFDFLLGQSTVSEVNA
jgi:trigger factor